MGDWMISSSGEQLETLTRSWMVYKKGCQIGLLLYIQKSNDGNSLPQSTTQPVML